jgi:hypothetical protein
MAWWQLPAGLKDGRSSICIARSWGKEVQDILLRGIFNPDLRHYWTKAEHYVQHEQSLQLESLTVGGAAHVFCGVYGIVVVTGASLLNVVALTRTGIAAPVLRLKTR